MRRFAAALVVLVLLAASAAACAAPGARPVRATPEPAAPAPVADRLVADLLAADRAFAAAVAERGLEAWVESFTPDGLQLSGARVVEGHADIRALMAPAFADPSFELSWDPEGARVSHDGSLGYTWGRYRARSGGAEVGNGRYVTLWRRQDDGGWRVEADIGSPAP